MKVAWFLVSAAASVALMPDATFAANKNCRAVEEPAQRLACYDAREDQKKEDRTVRQKANFGLSEEQKAPEERNEIEAVGSKIVQVNGSRVVLENDPVWQFERTSRITFWVRPGQDITIKKGLVGGYRASVKGVNGLDPVTRVQ